MGEEVSLSMKDLYQQPYAVLLFWTTNDLIDSRFRSVKELPLRLVAQAHAIARMCTLMPRALVVLGGRSSTWKVERIYDSLVSDLRAVFHAYGVACTGGEEGDTMQTLGWPQQMVGT